MASHFEQLDSEKWQNGMAKINIMIYLSFIKKMIIDIISTPTCSIYVDIKI